MLKSQPLVSIQNIFTIFQNYTVDLFTCVLVYYPRTPTMLEVYYDEILLILHRVTKGTSTRTHML